MSFLFKKHWKPKGKAKSELRKKLEEIKRRIHSDYEESGGDKNNSIFSELSSDLKLPTALFSGMEDSNSYKQNFKKLTAKELEYELKNVLCLYKNYRDNNFKQNYIIFIVDELDKLEPEFVETKSNLTKSREEARKETILNLLGNLKSFVHTAEAKFIFIGGAEMYDASLADISDRESFYSSIFNEVFYVNSFFKDYTGRRKTNITEMFSTYLMTIFLKEDGEIKENFLSDTSTSRIYREFYQKLPRDGENDSDKDLLLYHVNQFILYLTYRSNGSPKKLRQLVDYNIISSTNDLAIVQEDSCVIGFESKEVKGEIINLKENRPKKKKKVGESIPGLSKNENTDKDVCYSFLRLMKNPQTLKDELLPPGNYLRLEYRHQYKVGLLTSIFLPYLIKNESYFKEYNDKNLYLSAFLMDHILKFHKSAFSWRQIEIMPDIIIGSKDPNLRDTLSSILSYLSVKHIRETTNSMYKYKFRSRTASELRYISKISEESAAAFNFTYDESQHLKLFFKRKLKEKIESYRENKSFGDDSYIHTLAFLNSTIADVHFYDEEYDSAIRYYSDAIQGLNKLQNKSNHQKILYTRDRLLLSLCFEKSNRYESAYSILRSIILDSNKFRFAKEEVKNGAAWEDPYKRMQLFLRPHLALVSIIEKNRSDGLTFSNLKRNISEFTNFMDLKCLFPEVSFNESLDHEKMLKNGLIGDSKRIQTLLADYYQNVGSILFYKNRNFKSLFEWGAEGILHRFLNIADFPHKFHSNFSMDKREIEIDGKVIDQKKKYFSLDNVRKFYGKERSEFYFPSFASFFYYVISLNHLLFPYIENINSIFANDDEKFNSGDQNQILEKLVFEDRTSHILGGKQKGLIALVLGQMADAVLSCLGKITVKKRNLRNRRSYGLKEKNVQEWTRFFKEVSCIEGKQLLFNDFFSIQTVLYYNLLSYEFYRKADKYYDALFNLKKCIYIITSHKEFQQLGDKHHINLFTNWLFDECNEILKKTFLSTKENNKEFFRSIKGEKFAHPDLFNSEDEEEVGLLRQRFDSFNLRSKSVATTDWDDHTKNPQVVNNIFSRIQKLKFTSDIHYKKYKETIQKFDSDFQIAEITEDSDIITFSGNGTEIKCDYTTFIKISKLIIFCYKNLFKTINTYGISYTMSYSYLANIYKNVVNWCPVAEKIEEYLRKPVQKSKKDKLHQDLRMIFEDNLLLFRKDANVEKAIENYEKAISVHSEGAEYKSMIRDMYMLEDDFNDNLTHFFAALERSLINVGIVETNLKRLNEMKVTANK
ncbi:hypothetical protein GCM10007103_14660 [Salinimicrobium marinum]|uniref:Uncharacterized protein n=2 Tax=Salinimicrobium marinum TaxID=680283 RepID=A0A918SCE0_9FLAO|nr:hypothetical protein GCM10007103_14660 [Salinimicrobium marinum]